MKWLFYSGSRKSKRLSIFYLGNLVDIPAGIYKVPTENPASTLRIYSVRATWKVEWERLSSRCYYYRRRCCCCSTHCASLPLFFLLFSRLFFAREWVSDNLKVRSCANFQAGEIPASTFVQVMAWLIASRHLLSIAFATYLSVSLHHFCILHVRGRLLLTIFSLGVECINVPSALIYMVRTERPNR